MESQTSNKAVLYRNNDTGVYVAKNPTVRSERYREYLYATRSENTAYSYVASAIKFEEFLKEKQILLKDAEIGILEDFVVWLSGRKLGPATIHLHIVGAKAYTEWCRIHDEHSCKEFIKPRLPKLSIKVPKVLSAQQSLSFLKEVYKLNDPAKTALLIMPFCGLRVNEMCSVKMKDIFTKNGKDGKTWTVFLVRGKGNKERVAPLFHDGAKILSKYLLGWRLKRKSDFLFPGKSKEDGKEYLSPKTLQAHLRHIRGKVGVDDLTPHLLRKTCFTSLHKKGVPIEIIAWIAGHSSIDTTLKHYISMTADDVISQLDVALDKKKEGKK